MPRRKLIYAAFVAMLLLVVAAFAIAHAMAVPVRDEMSLDPPVGWSTVPPDMRLIPMIARAERDYRWFPIAGHRGKLRLAHTYLQGDHFWILFALPTELDYVTYRGTLHDRRLTSKAYFRATIVTLQPQP